MSSVVAGAALNAEMLSRLKHGALLINTSRGRLVDTVAATEALTKDQRGGLGLDVCEQEADPFFRDLSRCNDYAGFKLSTLPHPSGCFFDKILNHRMGNYAVCQGIIVVIFALWLHLTSSLGLVISAVLIQILIIIYKYQGNG